MADADPQRTFNIHAAKTSLSQLADRAHAGEEIVLAKAGVPWARLVPLAADQRPPRKPGRWAHLLKGVSEEAVMAPCFTDEEIEAFENASVCPPEI